MCRGVVWGTSPTGLAGKEVEGRPERQLSRVVCGADWQSGRFLGTREGQSRST